MIIFLIPIWSLLRDFSVYIHCCYVHHDLLTLYHYQRRWSKEPYYLEGRLSLPSSCQMFFPLGQKKPKDLFWMKLWKYALLSLFCIYFPDYKPLMPYCRMTLGLRNFSAISGNHDVHTNSSNKNSSIMREKKKIQETEIFYFITFL